MISGLCTSYDEDDVRRLLHQNLRSSADDDEIHRRMYLEDVVMLGSNSQHCFNGYAVVSFEDERDVARLFRLRDKKMLDGNELRVGIVETYLWREGVSKQYEGLL